MNRIFIVLVTVVLFAANASAQQHRLDSLLRVLKAHPEPSAARLRILLAVGKTYNTIHPKKALEVDRESERLAIRLGDERARILSQVNASQAYLYAWRQSEADSVGRLALAGAEHLGDPCCLALALSYLWEAEANAVANDTVAQRRVKDRFARAKTMARRCGDATVLADVLCTCGLYYALNTDPGVLEDALQRYRALGDSSGVGICLIYLSGFEPYLSDAAGRDRNLQHALELFIADGNVAWENIAHVQIAALAQERSDYRSALDHGLASVRMAERMEDLNIMAAAESGISRTYRDLGDLQTSKEYILRALKHVDFWVNRWTFLCDLARCQLALHHPDTVLVLLDRALAEHPGLGGDHGDGEYHCLMGDALGMKGEVRRAWEHYRTSNAILGRSRRQYWEEAQAALGMGRLLMRAPTDSLSAIGLDGGRARQQAAGYFERVLEIGKTQSILKEQERALLELSRLRHAQGDIEQAYELHVRYDAMKDSVLTVDKTKAVALLQIQYENEKKEARARAEQDKKDAVAAEELRRKNLQRNAFIGGFGLMLLLAVVFFLQRNRIDKEKKRSEDLLLNILPKQVAEELKTNGEAEAKQIDNVTVLFTDFKGFTAMSEQLSPKELVRDIHECFSAFDHIMAKYGIEKIKTIGDAYMAAGGLPTPNTTHALDVVRAAFEIKEFIAEGKARKLALGAPYFEVRIGIHTGPVVAGIVGVKKFAYDIWGDTVNTASRMESSGEVGQVNISESTYALVKDEPGLAFTSRGKVQAKGKGEMEMYFVTRT